MGNQGCCASPSQTTDDVPIPAANDQFISWCFDALEDNVITDLQDETLNDVIKRCDELRQQAKEVEFQKLRSMLPKISAEKVKEVESYFIAGSVWIGKVVFEGENNYLEIIIGRSSGKGRRVVDFEKSEFADGYFYLTAEVDVSKKVKNKLDHERHGFKIIFNWEDDGADYNLRLLSDNFDEHARMLSGTAIINGDGAGSFELMRAIGGKSAQMTPTRKQSNKKPTLRDMDSISMYSTLALGKSVHDLEGTSVKNCVTNSLDDDEISEKVKDCVDNNSNFSKGSSRKSATSADEADLSFDGYAYE